MASGKMNPGWPTKASHRFLKKILGTAFKGKVEEDPKAFDMVSNVFKKAGGSWRGIFRGGSSNDIDLLKKVIRVAIKRGTLKKKSSLV